MKKILLGVIASALMVSFGYCQEPTQPLQLTIKSNKQIYLRGELIYVDYQIKNTSQDAIKVLTPFSRSALIQKPADFFIKGKEWEKQKPIWAVVEYAPGGPGKVIMLKAGGTYSQRVNIVKYNYQGKQISYEVLSSDDMDSLPGGDYTITAAYDWPADSAKAHCPEADCWTGTLTSNTITIKVKARK